uniref:Uncharacterized protein n=1 Tax=Trypanosoma vivax (strain Y486) TaxID=1055687 RepID=G0TUH4_TRYVY|nr:conserved hypothetical protein, fragment [Trypanosoma vivax Y486]
MDFLFFLQQINYACREGRVSEALAADIKTHLALPFVHCSASHPPTFAPASTAPPPVTPQSSVFGGAGGSLGGLMGTSQQPKPTLAQLNAVIDTSATREATVGTFDEQMVKGRCLLNLLLLCDSRSQLSGVNETMAHISSSASSNIVKFIESELSPAMLTLSDHNSTFSLHNEHGNGGAALLAAQCLFLLTRHFQAQELLVRELCALLELLLDEVRNHSQNGVTRPAAFRQHPSTRVLCALTWFVTMSLVNSLAVWRELRHSSGSMKPNMLLHTSMATEIENWMDTIQKKMESVQDKSFLSFSASKFCETSCQARQTCNTITQSNDGRQVGCLAIVHGYISIIQLAVGIFLCGKGGDERGHDKAVEAFIGNRAQSVNAARRGKVMKYIVDLVPSQEILSIPLESIYVVPYEVATYMFDEMLVAVKYVADMDVRSCVRYVEASQLRGDRHHTDRQNSVTVATGTEGTGVLHPRNPAVQPEEGFMSEIAHVLRALTICLENLPSSVLNPDIDADCAVTFFTFKNCMTHMRSVFQTQRSNGLWEPYTLKLVSRFIDLLAMIGRNPNYTERIVTLFGEMQVECTELQWSSLIAQAQECSGASGGVASLLSCDIGGNIAAVKKSSAEVGTGTRHRQFTLEYLHTKQQEFVSSVFMILRQVATHHSLRKHVRQYITLNIALEFLYATRLSQPVLGGVLSLVGSLITDQEGASRVWTFLEENSLIFGTSGGTMVDGELKFKAASQSRQPHAHEEGRGGTADNAVVKVEARSLLGHCQYECHHGKYNITVGFLDLMLAMFRHHTMEMANLTTYTAVIRFIAEEIMRGVTRRFFFSPHERYVVIALAAAVLNRALSVRATPSSSNIGMPFQFIMACSRAPADVLGELLQIISEASTVRNEMLNYQRAAVRQCLALLKIAIIVKEEQGLDNIFTFDARTFSNTELAIQLLPLCGSGDYLLANKALEILLLLPQSTLSQAARHWFSRPDAQEAVITPFVTALREEAVSGYIIHAPPSLALLDYDEVKTQSVHAGMETKSLMLDLLIKHASAPQTSITSWLCGYPLYGPATELLPSYCLEPIIAGARSRALEATHAHIAIKYAKLVYLLRANPSLSTPGLQRVMKLRGIDELFHVVLTLRPDQCPPQTMSKYAFVIKLLALELFSIENASLSAQSAPPPLAPQSNLIELLYLLLEGSAQPLLQETGVSSVKVALDSHDVGVALDFARWPAACLGSLPVFPTNCTAPGGAENYIFQACDGIPQYSIPQLYEALKTESAAEYKEAPPADEIRQHLTVFVRANECLASYANAVQFIEAWCTLTSVTVTVLENISEERVMYLARCLLDSVQLTSTLTMAAQEQIVYRISQTLSTLMGNLKAKAAKSNRGENLNRTRGGVQSSVEALCAHNGHQLGADVSDSQWISGDPAGSLGATSMTLSQKNSGNVAEGTGLFCGRKRTGSEMVASRHEFHEAGAAFASAKSQTGLCRDNLQLLKALLVATVQWGSRVPLSRHHLYNAITTFVGIPGVVVDDVALHHYHNALFDVVVKDTAATASNANRMAALSLLSVLLLQSPQLCELLCVSPTANGVCHRLMTCVTSCFQVIDESTSLFFSHGGTNISSVTCLVQVVFDLLIIISQRHAVQLLHINALSHCTSMKLWNTSARVVLGHTNHSPDSTALSEPETIEAFKEVIMTLLLSTLRWFNATLLAVENSKLALAPIVQFICTHQLLFQSVLSSPTAAVPRRFIDTQMLELYSEISGVLQKWSSSSLVGKCWPLVHQFALPDLLDVLTKSEFIESPIFLCSTGSTAAALPAAAQRSSLPSVYQRQLVATATQNIAMLLFFVEHTTSDQDDERDGIVQQQTVPCLHDDPRNKALIIAATEKVAGIMENLYQLLHLAIAVPYLIGIHSLVLTLHAFLLADRCLPANNAASSNQWGHIVRTLEAVQRAAGQWKALHSDYHKGLKLSYSGDRWSVAAPSVSNQCVPAARVIRELDEGHNSNADSQSAIVKTAASPAVVSQYDTRVGCPTQGVESAEGRDNTNCHSTLTVPAVHGRQTIGALIDASQGNCQARDSMCKLAPDALDGALLMESLLRRIKVAVSNALREVLRS